MGLAAELIGRILRQRRRALELLVISIVDTLVWPAHADAVSDQRFTLVEAGSDQVFTS
jgi:hypothetical protein